MQPFIPARLKQALTFLRLRVPGGPVDDPADLPAARAGLEALARQIPSSALPPMRSVTDLFASVPESDREDGWRGLIRLFEPARCTDRGAAIMEVHGGGFTQGSVAAFQRDAMRLAADTGLRVASVEYRLAPEHPFPTAPHDVARAARWLFAHAADIGVDPGRILFTGASAGANLIMAAALLLRDEGHALPAALMPVCGSFTPGDTDSARRFAEPVFGLGGRALERNLTLYLNRPEDRFHPLVSPVLADLRGLPPVCLFAAALDPLFDDSFALASALRAQGGECYLIEMPGVAHCGVPFGYDPAFRTLMARLAADLLGAGKPGRPRGSAV